MKKIRNILKRDIKQMVTKVIPDKRLVEMSKRAELEIHECVCAYEVGQRILEQYQIHGYTEEDFDDDCREKLRGSILLRTQGGL